MLAGLFESIGFYAHASKIGQGFFVTSNGYQIFGRDLIVTTTHASTLFWDLSPPKEGAWWVATTVVSSSRAFKKFGLFKLQ